MYKQTFEKIVIKSISIFILNNLKNKKKRFLNVIDFLKNIPSLNNPIKF